MRVPDHPQATPQAELCSSLSQSRSDVPGTANGSTEKLRDLLIDLVGKLPPVVLAKEETRIYFTKKQHLADKAILGKQERTELKEHRR